MTADDRLFERIAEHFALLADPTRLKILRALCDGERNVGDVVHQLGANQTNVSRHLSLMHAGGIVTRRREGAMVFYAIADEHVIGLCRLACAYVAPEAAPARKTPRRSTR